MEKYYFVVDLVVYSIFPTLIVLYFTERVKGSVKNSFDEKLEDLKKEHSIEIANFQTELNSLKAKENFKFTKLHEKRFEVLQETHKFLNEHLNLLNYYVEPNKYLIDDTNSSNSELTLRQNYRSAHNVFLNYFNDNSIFFKEDIEEQLKNYFCLSAQIYNTYEINSELFSKLELEGFTIDINSINVSKESAKLLVPIKKQIEFKFREVLGE